MFSRDDGLFLHLLQTLEELAIPYVIVGGFAATLYGSSRVTYDIDIVVDLNDEQIAALCAAYPLPRYYADPEQMRDSSRRGIMFNLIDTDRGEKADLVPISGRAMKQRTLQRRIRQTIALSATHRLDVWCARPDDVILGKLQAWQQGRSARHESDIYAMMVVDTQQGESGADTLIDYELGVTQLTINRKVDRLQV